MGASVQKTPDLIRFNVQGNTIMHSVDGKYVLWFAAMNVIMAQHKELLKLRTEVNRLKKRIKKENASKTKGAK